MLRFVTSIAIGLGVISLVTVGLGLVGLLNRPVCCGLILVGLTLVYSIRLSRNPAAPVLVRIASAGYAVPGTVLAVGLLVPIATLDNVIADSLRASFGVSTGLILTGSGAVLRMSRTF